LGQKETGLDGVAPHCEVKKVANKCHDDYCKTFPLTSETFRQGQHMVTGKIVKNKKGGKSTGLTLKAR